jgi:hypothetical protein
MIGQLCHQTFNGTRIALRHHHFGFTHRALHFRSAPQNIRSLADLQAARGDDGPWDVPGCLVPEQPQSHATLVKNQ